MKEISKPKPVTATLTRFVETDGNYQEPLTVATFGAPGVGKSRLGATMPGKIGAVILDRKGRFSVSKAAQEFGKTVLMPAEDFVRASQPMLIATLRPLCDKPVKVDIAEDQPACCATHYYRWHVNRIKAAMFELAEICDSLFLDTGTQFWEDILFAHFGRAQRIMPIDRGAPNQEMKDFVNAVSHRHLLITHQPKEVWRAEKPTGIFEQAGYPHIGHYVSIMLEQRRVEIRDGVNRRYAFIADVKQCQANAALYGDDGKAILEDDSVTFQNLALKVYPNSEPEMWE